MNNAEAKFILQGYRPNGADADDATFNAALEQARKDPALAEWFAKQRAFDAAISAKLMQVTPPADLRAAILAGGRVSEAAPKRGGWNRPAWMAVAAGLAVIFAGGVALWPKQAAAFNAFAVADAKMSAIHGGHGDETNALQAFMSDPATKLGQKIPFDLSKLHLAGCRTVGFKGHEVLEICFSRDGVWFHAYIGRAKDMPGAARSATPRIAERDGIATASWHDDEHVVVVVSKTGRKNLEAWL